LYISFPCSRFGFLVIFFLTLFARYFLSQAENLVDEEVVEWEFDRINGQRKVLGQGATAKVYAAFNKKTHEGIAVKELQVLKHLCTLF
jgi:hypothetical protein